MVWSHQVGDVVERLGIYQPHSLDRINPYEKRVSTQLTWRKLQLRNVIHWWYTSWWRPVLSQLTLTEWLKNNWTCRSCLVWKNICLFYKKKGSNTDDTRFSYSKLWVRRLSSLLEVRCENSPFNGIFIPWHLITFYKNWYNWQHGTKQTPPPLWLGGGQHRAGLLFTNNFVKRSPPYH